MEGVIELRLCAADESPGASFKQVCCWEQTGRKKLSLWTKLGPLSQSITGFRVVSTPLSDHDWKWARVNDPDPTEAIKGPFFYYSYDEDMSPILEVKAIARTESVPLGFSRVTAGELGSFSLVTTTKHALSKLSGTSGSHPVPVSVSSHSIAERVSAVSSESRSFEQSPRNFERKHAEFSIGDYVDARDKAGWNVARIVDIRRVYEYFVHYEGWDSKFDEWIDIRTGRITRLREHSFGYTGRLPKHFQTDVFDLDNEYNWAKVKSHLAKLDKILCLSLTSEMTPNDVVFISENIVDLGALLLKAKAHSQAQLKAVVEFVDKLISLMIMFLKENKLPSFSLLHLLGDWLQGDETRYRFFAVYGVSIDDSFEDGKFASRKV